MNVEHNFLTFSKYFFEKKNVWRNFSVSMCKWLIIHFFIVVNWKLKMTMMMMITSQFQGVEIIFW